MQTEHERPRQGRSPKPGEGIPFAPRPEPKRVARSAAIPRGTEAALEHDPTLLIAALEAVAWRQAAIEALREAELLRRCLV